MVAPGKSKVTLREEGLAFRIPFAPNYRLSAIRSPTGFSVLREAECTDQSAFFAEQPVRRLQQTHGLLDF